MSQQEFLYLNLIVVLALFVGFFLFRRKPTTPSPIDFRAQSEELGVRSIQNAVPKMSSGVVFNYNGHTWDAYEVLGLKLGASVDEIRAAFNKAFEVAHPSTHEFLKEALQVVLTDLKKTGYKPEG